MDRRRAARHPAQDLGIVEATIRPGRHVRIVEASTGGAEIETERQLRPGARVHLRIEAASGTLAVAAHVLRCTVVALHAEGGVTYRGAVKFDERCAGLSVGGAAAPGRGDEPSAAEE
jgi:hypothetical protein